MVEDEAALRLGPGLPPHHLQPGPGTVGPVADRDPGEVPGGAGAVDQARPPPSVASGAAVLVDGAPVLPGLVGINTTMGNTGQFLGVATSHS